MRSEQPPLLNLPDAFSGPQVLSKVYIDSAASQRHIPRNARNPLTARLANLNLGLPHYSQQASIGGTVPEIDFKRELMQLYQPSATEVVERLHGIVDSRAERTGKHHEIYLTDTRRTDPAKWRKIIRQPIR